MSQDLQYFRNLLPFFVNGTLNETDKTFVETYLLQHPEAQAEVNFVQALRTAVKAVGEERNENVGLGHLLASIRQNRKATISKPGGLLERWQQCLHDWGLTPAFVTLSVIVIIQSTVLIKQWHQNASPAVLSTYRSFSGATAQADIKVIISPNAAFDDIVILLRQTGCQIVNGPSESGELWLSVDNANRLAEVNEILQASPNIIDLSIITSTKK
jgi:hypothetical protein